MSGTVNLGRRAFLHGQRIRRIVSPPRRPPWAVDEERFTRNCDRCGACVMACPTGLLLRGTGGFPEANFQRAHCTFCADCVRACAKNAIRDSPRETHSPFSSLNLPPWTLQAVIDFACLPHNGALCRSCEDHCEEGAVRFIPCREGPAQPEIVASRCNGCGECVSSCPASAIQMRPVPSSPSPESPQQ